MMRPDAVRSIGFAATPHCKTAMDIQGKHMNKKVSVDQAWLDYRKSLLAFIRVRVDTQDDAEDILQEVFSTLIQMASEDKHPSNIGPWLYQVTKNRIIDYYRTKKRFETLPDDLVAEPVPFDAIMSLSQCLLPLIHTLPERYQQPLMLSEIQGQKHKAVASELNLTLPAVKSRIFRGRKMLYANVLSCCAINRGRQGSVVDFDIKSGRSCDDCDC